MKKLILIICALAVVTGMNSSVYANGNCPPREITPEMKAKWEAQREQRKAEFDKRLNLSPEQKEQMKAIHEQSKTKIKPIFEALKTEKEKLAQLKTCPTTPKEEISTQEAKIKQLRCELKEIRKANFEATQKILTPAQQKEFNKMHEERKKMHKHHKNFDKKFER